MEDFTTAFAALFEVNMGVRPGERIVVEGLQKVKEGMLVNPKSVDAEAKTAPPTAPKKD